MGITSNATRVINAAPGAVWKAITDPAMIKQYLFGTDVTTDWKVGSPITYKGVWQGKAYEDKGKILTVIPEKVLESTYWSSMSGLADSPENYKRVRYALEPEDGGTKITITQDNNATEEEKNHTEQNWNIVLDGLKKLLEQKIAPK